jgi:redox-sensitive bicupin YhaK (pirin superfamily)
MTPEKSLARGTSYLDEATENLTFEEFHWAFEETWRGVAWVLNALADPPKASLSLGPKGQVPPADTLDGLTAGVPKLLSRPNLLSQLKEVHAQLADAEDVDVALAANAKQIEQLVFDAWEFHNACGERLGVVDERLGDKLILTEVSPGTIGSRRMHRRAALKLFAAASLLPLAACEKVERDNRAGPANKQAAHKQAAAEASSGATAEANVKAVTPIRSMQWKTSDPFLFCAYHVDDYPAGNANLGPAASLAGRHLGRDFDENEAWRMYHGQTVPGFPRHPHRGFETVTVVRSGMLDHADSMGATARYGGGDVQWLTAGGGIQHAEMFPLLAADTPNPLELFQIWLNLPRADKMVDPYFTMFWNEKIPRVIERDAEGRVVELTLTAGGYNDLQPPSPPPNSWASKPESDLAIWTLRMQPGAKFELPAVSPGTKRSLYVHRGAGIKLQDTDVPNQHRAEVDAHGPLLVTNGPSETEILLLQGRPIGEPVAKRGPFVMNTQQEIRQAYADYQQTQFGGWPWQDSGPVHERKKGRFARHIDGRLEEPS